MVIPAPLRPWLPPWTSSKCPNSLSGSFSCLLGSLKVLGGSYWWGGRRRPPRPRLSISGTWELALSFFRIVLGRRPEMDIVDGSRRTWARLQEGLEHRLQRGGPRSPARRSGEQETWPPWCVLAEAAPLMGSPPCGSREASSLPFLARPPRVERLPSVERRKVTSYIHTQFFTPKASPC